MTEIQISLRELLQIKNAIYTIKETTDQLNNQDKINRKYGINPQFTKINEYCEIITAIISNININEVSESKEELGFTFKEITEIKENDFNIIQKRLKKNVIQRNSTTKEYWLPIELIKFNFKIGGEIGFCDIERKILSKDKTKYLYLRIE